MTADLLTILLLLATAILMFAFNRPRADAVAVIMMTALPFTGVITVQESIAGFSNPNIVLIGAMFVIGEALARTGVAQSIGDWLATRGGDSAWRLLTMLMLAVGVLGSVMSSTGVVAMFIPVVLRIASRKGIAAGKLMMPMAYAALISGMMTLVATSPNLIINYELVRFGAEGFQLLLLHALRCAYPVRERALHAGRTSLARQGCGRRLGTTAAAQTQTLGRAIQTGRARVPRPRAPKLVAARSHPR
jgi:hypothetical protein